MDELQQALQAQKEATDSMKEEYSGAPVRATTLGLGIPQPLWKGVWGVYMPKGNAFPQPPIMCPPSS